MKRRVGFTLIELLVVVAILALLMGILMPALTAVREQGRRAVCGQNEKNTGLGLFLYAQDWDGKLPQNAVDRWLFDISYWTTDIIMKSGNFDRDIFYCPSYPVRNRIYYWRYGEGLAKETDESYSRPEPTADSTRKNYHRIIGYFWMIDYDNGSGGHRANPPMTVAGESPKEWVRSTLDTKQAPALIELITDVTASDGADRYDSDFTEAKGGVWSRWNEFDSSSHTKGTKCVGSSIFFLDGHVQWRNFVEMEHRWFWQSNANPCFWW